MVSGGIIAREPSQLMTLDRIDPFVISVFHCKIDHLFNAIGMSNVTIAMIRQLSPLSPVACS